jgi:hypothetical protein
VAAAVAAASAASLHVRQTASDQTPLPSPTGSLRSGGKKTPPATTSAVPPLRGVPTPPADATAVDNGSSSRRGSAETPFAILSSRRGSGDASDPNLVAWAFHLSLEAFLQLSSGGKTHTRTQACDAHRCISYPLSVYAGVIRREDLSRGIRQLAMMSPARLSGSHGPDGFRTASAEKSARGRSQFPVSALEFLADDRFAELDWDEDGQITFREFLFAFVNWTGVEDQDEEGDSA